MVAGNEEEEPLIAVETSRSYENDLDTAASRGPSPRFVSDSDEISIYIPNKGKNGMGEYGSMANNNPLAERITYMWYDINVYTTEQQNQGRGICGWWKGSAKKLYQQRKHLLRNVHGAAYPGELLAIMGSSGAGKTTLLNALTFRSTQSVVATGIRTLNGQLATPDMIAALSAYVQQEDMFIGTLTVKEHLIFQALVRMDRHIPYAKRMQRVNEVISELALTKCQNTVIGIPGRLKGISGGEMKRLAFASEVLTDPPLMFCDEPTSGLDSFMAQNVIQVLKGLASKGKTIIVTIHQPSSELYAMFDKLLIVADGRVGFLGSPVEAALFFKELGAACPVNYNPADHYMQLLAAAGDDAGRHTLQTICDAFATSEAGQRLASQTEKALLERKSSSWWQSERKVSRYKASWWMQLRAVLWRSWISVTKEPMVIKVRFLQTIMVALLIGVIYFGQNLDQDGVMNINGALFMFLTNLTFQNVLSVINVFCTELPIFLREHKSGMYRVDVYFICKTLAEAPIFASTPLLFTIIVYYMIGLNPDPIRFLITAGLAALITNVATSFGYLISCVSSSLSMAASVGPPLLVPFMLFGGFFLNSGSIPPYLEWISYLSWFRYGNEALLINQWAGVDRIACTRANTTCPGSGHLVLEALSFSEADFTMNIINMVMLFAGFRLLAFLALLLKTKRNQ